MNDVKTFEHSDFGNLDIIVIGGKEWFPATRCAKILGHENPARAVRKYCKGVTKSVTPTDGGAQTINYISEGDLYRLIVFSKLPSAAKFEKWIFDIVLPSIRRTGSYTCGTNSDVQALNERLDRLEYALLDKRMETLEAVKEVRDYRRPEQFPPHIKAALDCMIEHDIRLGAIMDFLDDNGIWVPKYELQRYIKRKVDEIV